MSHVVVAATTDRVLVAYPLPKGCTLNRIHLRSSVVGPEAMTIIQACMYGISGFVVPILDPDTPDSVDDIWDFLVPKDIGEGAGVFDLDTSVSDTTPEFNFGEPDMTGIFGVANNEPIEIFRRRKLLTVANSVTGLQVITAASDEYLPTDFFTTTIKKSVRAGRHSFILIGFSSPDASQTDITVKQTIAEAEWVMMTYIETFLENAAQNLLGLVEAGAETPYAEASAFVAELIEDVVHEDTAGAFKASAFNIFTQATFDVSVPGRMMVGGVLTSE